MLYEFKSRATGNLVMTQKVAERLLAIIGKAPGPTGIILPEQMPAAIRSRGVPALTWPTTSDSAKTVQIELIAAGADAATA